MHEVIPWEGLNDPAAQATQPDADEFAPVALPHVPEGHNRQLDDERDPTAVLNVPRSHMSHDVAPEYVE